jgi:hypothetical protein
MPRRASLVLSHWFNLIEGLQHSPNQFYTSVEESLTRRKLADVDIERVLHHEGGIFSAEREYLRVKRNEHIFDICAAPYGNGFFVSWWLGESSGFREFLLMIPFVGPLLVRIFKPDTYYRVDTTLMFQESVHTAVLEVIDDVTQAQGIRSLTEFERKPIMKEMFKR